MYEWKKYFPVSSLGNGKMLYTRNKVRLEKEQENVFSAKVIENKTSHVKIVVKPQNASYNIKCDCAVATGGKFCKHMAAAMYALEALGQGEVATEHAEDTSFIVLSEAKQPTELRNVDWKEVELSEYSYFEMDTLIKSMDFSERTMRHAKQLLKEQKVLLNSFELRYYMQKTGVVAECLGTGFEGRRQFSILLVFDRVEVLRTICECKECRNSYYRYYYGEVQVNACAYIAALMLLVAEKIEGKNIGDATDRNGRLFLSKFLQKQNVYEMSKSEAKRESLTLHPKLVKKDGRLKAAFKIEDKRSFVIKDLKEFYEHVQNAADSVYGSSTVINHDIENFTRDSQKWITYIGKAVLEEQAFGQAVEERGGFISGSTKMPMIELFGSRLDELYGLLGEKEVAYEDKDLHLKTGLLCREQNPKVQIRIRKSDECTAAKFHGIHVSYEIPKHYEGIGTAYYIENGFLFRMQEEFYRRIAVLLHISQKEEVSSFEIGRMYLPEFYHSVLPQLEEVAEIVEEDYEEISRYLPPKVCFVFYLDVEQGNVSCKIAAKYGNREHYVTKADENVLYEPYRDLSREGRIRQIVEGYFPLTDGESFYCGNDENRMYEFLYKGLQELIELGEVQCTKRFRNLKINKKLHLRVGVALESGLLDLTVTADDISQDEITEILKSYRAKKKYHKLKNGDFLTLEEETIAALDEIVEVLRLSPKELKKGRVRVPVYRALYLDKMLEKNDEIYHTRDSHFRSLVKGFKNVADAEFEEPASLKDTMREYQKEGYKWLCTLEKVGFGGILADDMGLGKTLQMIAVLLAAKERGSIETSLIVAPASLVYNWEEEIKRFAPALSISVIAGTQEERRQKIHNYQYFDVLITSYDLLKRDIVFYEDKHFLYEVLDEAQYIKNHTTAAAKAVKLIKSEVRYALTGTPIENRLSELWSIFDYLMPGYLYGYEAFRSDFESPIVKYNDEVALERLKRMTTPFIMRRLKEQVLKELPDKLEESCYMQLEKEQQRLYDAQVLHMKQQIAMQNADEFKQNKMQLFAELMKIRQICCEPSLCFENYKGQSAKLETCMELVRNAIEGGHRILLFSQFTSMLDILEECLEKEHIQSYMITGAVSKEKRLQLVKAFNEGAVPVFLISLKAGGVGLNLTGADVVIHYDPWWNVAVQNQATDRAYRIGQTKKVVVYKLIAKNTIEEKIEKLQESKKALSEQIVQGDGNMFSSMSKEDFLNLFEI